MPKTLFGKLALFFSSLLILSSIITGIVLYSFLGSFVTDEKVKLIKQSAERVGNTINLIIETGGNLRIKRSIDSLLRSYGVATNSIVFIVAQNGNIVFDSGESIPKEVIDKIRNADGTLSFKDKKLFNGFFSTNDEKVNVGDFNGFFKGTNISWLTVIKPFEVDGNRGAVYFHTPLPELNKARFTVFNFYLLAVFFSLALSIVLLFFFTKKITKPIQDLNNGVRQIAKGNFENIIEVKSRDEIGELAKNFNHMAKELDKLEQMRKTFVADVSHELRTPMTSIKGFVDGILDGTIPEQQHEYYLNITNHEIQRLSGLINNLLELTKLDAKNNELKLKSFEVNELMRLCIIRLEKHILEKSIDIEANFAEKEIWVNGDNEEIERVIINLLHNAIKFSNMNKKIIIEVKRLKNKVNVSIQDEGIGINKEDIDMIWQRFYKADESRSIDTEGTGLGLSIVKSIINRHNQNIWVESEINKGSKFIFTLEVSENKL